MKFVNRKRELKFLDERWISRKSQLIVVYGRRRVGKTALIKQFIRNKPAIYFSADNRNEKEQLKELGYLAGNYFKDLILSSRGFNDWLEVFKYLKEKIKAPLILAVDEFPYLVEANKAVSSLFQKGWDEYLKDLPVFLILSGSSMAMMESEVLLYQAPLYGRRTGQILLSPFSFRESREFFPDKAFSDMLGFYALCGGIPAYFLQLSPRLALKKNIEKRIFPKTEFLHNEVEFILKAELREPRNYLAILKALSWGRNRLGEITNETGMAKNILTKYLSILEKLQMIEKEVPVTEKNPAKSRKGIYRISDNFFRFWFQYIFPYKSDLELERYEEIQRKIKESYHLFESNIYEKICHEILWNMRNKVSSFERIGRWWDKDKEIDVVALSSQNNEILFGEAKWSNKQVGTNIYYELKEKARFVQWRNDKRKEYYMLFSKSGFTANMRELARKEKVWLIHEDRLV